MAHGTKTNKQERTRMRTDRSHDRESNNPPSHDSESQSNKERDVPTNKTMKADGSDDTERHFNKKERDKRAKENVMNGEYR